MEEHGRRVNRKFKYVTFTSTIPPVPFLSHLIRPDRFHHNLLRRPRCPTPVPALPKSENLRSWVCWCYTWLVSGNSSECIGRRPSHAGLLVFLVCTWTERSGVKRRREMTKAIAGSMLSSLDLCECALLRSQLFRI